MAIGKTRQPAEKSRLEERFDPGLEGGRGLLRWPPQVGIGKHVRRRPASDLAPFIDCFWMVTWDLDQPYEQETLPHPNFYFAFQDRRATIGGVNTGKSTHVLEGRSGVFGIRFRPGGFRPFMSSAAFSLANRIVPARDIFLAREVADLEAALASSSWDEDPMIAETTAFLRKRLPRTDPEVEQADSLVSRIQEDSGIKTVKDLSAVTGLGVRTLQRIFREYVGANPKWVIRRFRLHELLEVMNSGADADWSQVALDLGYFDQAHLINDFKSIVGYTPAQYMK